MAKTAAVIGATGLVGSEILSSLLDDSRYGKVVVYSRKALSTQHPKLEVKIGDLLKDDIFEGAIEADDIFCAIGTTQAKSPDLSHYKDVDYGIPVRTAKFGINGGVTRYLVVSALGANEGSKMFYPRIKGQMEEALQKMALPRLHIFRPSYIMGERQEFRLGETIGRYLVTWFKMFIPKKYRGIQAADIASAMIRVANSPDSKIIFNSDEIQQIADRD